MKLTDQECRRRGATLLSSTVVLRSSAVVCVIGVSACVTYPLSSRLEEDIHRIRADGSAIVGNASKSAKEPEFFAGDIGPALDAANDQRKVYFQAIRDNTDARRIIGTSLLVLSGMAVYKGITSDSDSTKRWLARAGAAGGAAYGVTTYLSNRPAEAAYLEGYRDITCAILWTRPLLIPAPEMDAWKTEVVKLRALITEVDAELSVVQTKRYQELEQPGGALIHRNLAREFRHLYDALGKSRKLLEHSHTLERRVATAGFSLRRRVEAVTAGINMRVHAAENALPIPGSLVTDINKTTRTFTGIRPVEPADTGASDAGGAGAGAGAGSSAGSGDAKPAAETPKDTDTPAETPLGKAVDDKIQKLEGQKKKLESDRKKLASQNKKLQEENKQLRTQKPPATDPPPATAIVTSADRENLRRLLSRLYAQHRVVNQMLIGVNQMVKATREADPCRDPDSTLTVSPAVDDVDLKAGEFVEFTITGGHGYPRVHLMPASLATLTTTLRGGAVVARITAPDDTAGGDATLVVTDGTGRQRDDVVLHIQAKAPAPKKEEDK